MIDSLATALSAAARATDSGAAPGGIAPVAALDIESFRSAIVSGGSSSSPPAAATVVAPSPAKASPVTADYPRGLLETVPPPQGNSGPSIGESILSGLRAVSDDTRDRYNQIAEVLNNPSPSVSELMTLQFTLLQNSLQFDLTSKLISKAPQTVDSIVKAQ
jgi:type III secretion system YscI/HrpB-like protein